MIKPNGGYFKAYELSAYKYKVPDKLFHDKKSVVTKQVVKELDEMSGLKFQLGLTKEFFKDDSESCNMVIKWPS